MTSKAERRRKKKQQNPLGLPGLAASKKREKDGRFHRTTEERQSGDAEREALKARCRQAGKKPSMKNLREMRAPWHGCTAGRCMSAHAENETEKQRLWSAIQHMRMVQRSHDFAIGAPNRHPKCMKVEFLPEELSADASTPPKDDRTDAERQREATRALMAVEGWLGYTDSLAASEAKKVVLDDAPVRDRVGLMSALRCVADGLAGDRMVYRGRS